MLCIALLSILDCFCHVIFKLSTYLTQSLISKPSHVHIYKNVRTSRNIKVKFKNSNRLSVIA